MTVWVFVQGKDFVDCGIILSDLEDLETHTVEDYFASLGCFNPGGHHQQVELL